MTDIDDIAKGIDKLEAALIAIKDNNSNFHNNFSSLIDLSELKNIDRRISDAITAINAGTNKQFPDYTSKLDSISTEVTALVGAVNQIIGKAPDTAQIISEVKRLLNINAQQRQPNPTQPSNPGSNSNFTTFETIFRDILTEVKGIHTSMGTSFQVTPGMTQAQIDSMVDARLKADKKYAVDKVQNDADIKESRERERERLLKDPAYRKQYKETKKLEEKNKKEEKKLTDGGIKEFAVSSLKSLSGFLKGEKPNVSAALDNINAKVSQANPILGAILMVVKAGFDAVAKQDELAGKYAREFGGGKYEKQYQVQRNGRLLRSINQFGKTSYSLEDIYSGLTALNTTGRASSRQTKENVKSAIDLGRMGVGGDTLNTFDTFGKSAIDTDRYFARAYGRAGKTGLSFSKFSENIKNNLKAAQAYTFRNGLNGLMKMAEKSTELKMNMQEAFKFADKVSTIEGAITASANLSVLGGEFSQFSNPMAMLYEGLQDPEALQKRMIDIFGNMAHWDETNKQIDISAFNRQRIKAASEGMGVDYNEMINLAMNKERGNIIERQLVGKDINKDTKSYIKNLAQLDENGRAYISGADNERKYLDNPSQFSQLDVNFLKKESERKDQASGATTGDIWTSTRGIYDKINDILAVLQGKIVGFLAKIAGARGWGDKNAKKLWQDNEDYKAWAIEKYGDGSRRQARRMAKMGLIDEELFRKRNENEDLGELHMANGYVPGTSGILRGLSHSKGGIKGRMRGAPIELEGNEAIINKLSVAKYGEELIRSINNGSFNPNTKVKNVDSNIFNPIKFQEKEASAPQSVGPQKITFEPIKIDIGGNLNLNLQGANVGQINGQDLITPQFIALLTKEIQNRINSGGFDKENFYNKGVIV